MIEKFSREEIEEIIRELKDEGYKFKPNLKGLVLNQEAEKVFKCRAYITEDIRKPILQLADWATDNYVNKENGKTRKKWKG